MKPSLVKGIVLLYFFMSQLILTSATLSQLYTVKVEFDNKMSNSSLRTEHESNSLSECCTKCQTGCGCVGFRLSTMVCHTYPTCDLADMTGEEEENLTTHNVLVVLDIDCMSLYDRGIRTSGVYTIHPWDKLDPKYRPIEVYCDMETANGGWTAIQRRLDGSVDFNRTWNDYRIGFGSPHSAYWIGNDVIYQLTRNPSYFYISITLHNNIKLYEKYEGFSVSPGKFQMDLSDSATGTLGDGLYITAKPEETTAVYMKFTTYDQDNDPSPGNCAVGYGGGWWFRNCYQAFLNGPWASPKWSNPWGGTVSSGSDVKETVIMIKRY
ncbi:ficolin-1-like [Saccostrea cucullata]|uniref:ficolin-1-like n=1 Tax=Saccostrea cuccullata TaxID=36930 RepID=UPI002ED02471